jgi:transcriptional regulator with XRE-family HTH domain
MKNPDAYTAGLGELVRASRLYLGLSKDGMAHRLNMSDRSYERIESGERDCPPGLLDSIDAVMDAFDDEVFRLIADATASGDKVVEVSTDPREEWHRCVVGRAAVESKRVMPRLAVNL